MSNDEASINRDVLAAEYQARESTLAKLCEEAAYELRESIGAADIKLHSFNARVKDEKSFLEKVERKEYRDPWRQTEDLVGLRAVCLFRSDIDELERVARACFNVTAQHDTIDSGDAETFGYMSVHLTAELHDDRSGPRYDDIKGITFEVQLRTILMDAWANVSHYLDYKGGSSIPSELRRDFYALSGLFYVADKHFELFFDESRKRRLEVAAELEGTASDLDVELNLDTLLGFLATRLPERTHSEAAVVSDLVEELADAGYRSVAEVDAVFERAEKAALAYEREHPPFSQKGRKFNDVGLVRVALTIADERVLEVRIDRGTAASEDRYQEYSDLVSDDVN